MVPFPRDSHARSLEATDSSLPALSGCHIADGAVEHGLIYLSAYPALLLWKAYGCHTPAARGFM